MKKGIILFCATLLFSGSAQGQLNRETYNKAIDILNCKTVELSLKDSKESYFSNFQRECPCEQSDYSKIQNFFESNQKLTATIELSKEIESLKATFEDSLTHERAHTFLTQKIFSDKVKYPRLASFSNKRKDNPIYSRYIEDINTTIREILVNSSHSSTEDNETYRIELESKLDNLEERVSEMTENKGWLEGINSQFFFVSIFVYLILSLIIYFLYNRYIVRTVKNPYTFTIEDIRRETDKIKIIYLSEIDDMKNKISELQSHLKKLESQISVLSTDSTSKIDVVQPMSHLKNETKEIKSWIFFLQSPNRDGTFLENSASQGYKEGYTIYKFFKTENGKARFQIDENEASVKLALQYRDIRIDPVCDAINSYNPKTVRLVTVEQGEAELQNGKWIVNKKAKIRYEN